MKTKDFIIILLIIGMSVFGYFKVYNLEQQYNKLITDLGTAQRLGNLESATQQIVGIINNAQKQPQVVEPQTDEDN